MPLSPFGCHFVMSVHSLNLCTRRAKKNICLDTFAIASLIYVFIVQQTEIVVEKVSKINIYSYADGAHSTSSVRAQHG